MIDAAEIDRIAAALLAHRAQNRPNPLPAPETEVPDLATAYRIQAAATRLRVAAGDAAIGYKIAVTSAAARAMLGVDAPFFGRLFRSTTLAQPATLQAVAGLHTVYEPEIALLLGRDLPGSGAPYDAASLRAATRAVLSCIELVGTSFSPWAQAGAPRLAADNAAHAHWVIGDAIEDFAALDLMEMPITLSIDGAVAATGRPSLVEGGPFAAAAWLANTLADMGTPLRAGDYITTGTATQPMPIAAGQRVLADFGKLGQVSLRMTP
jgi:2-keto-4-pentenoate hydratase